VNYLHTGFSQDDFDAKHLIGHKFADPDVQSDIKHFPFKVFSKDGKPYIKVEYGGEEKDFVSVPTTK
jgi:hypothetical protein